VKDDHCVGIAYILYYIVKVMMVSLLAASSSLIQGRSPGRGPWEWHYYWEGGWWGFLILMLIMIFFWGFIIGGVALVVRFILSAGRGRRPPEALEILKQRYAKGEIEKAEFEEKKKDLMS
jgi:putative membrane protein